MITTMPQHQNILVHVPSCLDSLNTKTDYLYAEKLKTVFVDFRKLTDVVDIRML